MTTIYPKLLEFQKRVQAIKKDGKNPHFKSTYATLPQILSEVKPILSDLGLVLLQSIKDDHVCTTIIDPETGTNEASSMKLPGDLNPQQIGSAITYYRRYLLAGMLALELEDDDANTAVKKPEFKPLPAEKPQLTDAIWLKAKTKIEEGDMTVPDKLRANYVLNDHQDKTLKMYENEKVQLLTQNL